MPFFNHWIVPLLFASQVAFGAPALGATMAQILQGSNGPGRVWWDLRKYDLEITVDANARRIYGDNKITFNALRAGTHLMQIDLEEPMQIESVIDERGLPVKITREGNVYWLDFGDKVFVAGGPGPATPYFIHVRFAGAPVASKTPPWDGGWVWAEDDKGRPWISAAVESVGGSAWFPCKNDYGDEPDEGATITITPLAGVVAVSNGRVKKSDGHDTWEVRNPINTYNIIPYLGNYAHWQGEFFGERGPLDLDFWVLDYDLHKAKEQFKQASQALNAFEYWFGPYPFYEDSFKIVEAPYLGMEHQSAIAYGNGFKNGYKGKDLSGSGYGLLWDFIIVHEMAHEWFGNNITEKDIADLWIHEGFATYAEVLFLNYYYGQEAGNAYCIGLRKRVKGDRPIIAQYGVHQEGSSDMYAKGANMLHTIRQLIHDDEKFRQILRGLNRDFYHQTVTTQMVENYLSDKSGIKLGKIFDQYLRTTKIPNLEYTLNNETLRFRWTDVVDGFDMPVKLVDGTWLSPTTSWRTIQLKGAHDKIELDNNFYVESSRAGR